MVVLCGVACCVSCVECVGCGTLKKPVCIFETSPCVFRHHAHLYKTCGRGTGAHSVVLNVHTEGVLKAHTETCSMHTLSPQNTDTHNTQPHTATHNNTENNTAQHNTTQNTPHRGKEKRREIKMKRDTNEKREREREIEGDDSKP